jgi:hypothetical protein
MVVSDNLKSGITKACFYEPAVNRSYAEMAAHYETAIVPARPRKPRDKAKVEVAVLLATRWIIARLRNRRFFSLADLNAAIRDCVTDLNARVSRHLGASRARLFEDLERPALKPLPAEPYAYAEWKQCRGKRTFIVSDKRSLASITMSRWRSITTPCRTCCCARRYGRRRLPNGGNASSSASVSKRRKSPLRESWPSFCTASGSMAQSSIGASPQMV